MQKLNPTYLIIGIPLAIIVLCILLFFAVLLAPFLTIGFIFWLKAKKDRMKLSSEHKLSVKKLVRGA
jgi:hypothetical protein